jgi:hypothetical protein
MDYITLTALGGHEVFIDTTMLANGMTKSKFTLNGILFDSLPIYIDFAMDNETQFEDYVADRKDQAAADKQEQKDA